VTDTFQIVIVLYNSAGSLSRALGSIARLAPPSVRTWVVDNASTDGGADRVARDYPWVRLLISHYNRGFAGGCNWAAAQEPGPPLILFLNPDAELTPGCLQRLAEAFERHSRLGVAGCKLLRPDGQSLQHVGGALRPNALPYHLGEGELDRGQYRGLRPSEYVQGAALAVRRSVFDALGGFDEGFYPAYFEEADLCFRARRAGWGVAVVCEAAVIHHQDPRRQVQDREFLKMLFRGRARYLIKHYRPRDWLLRYLPAEVRWLLSRRSKTYRRLALRSLWEVWTGTPTPPGRDGIHSPPSAAATEPTSQPLY